MPQAVDCNLIFYADSTCLLCQHKDLDQINKELTKTFCNTCDWFVDNKLGIHFGEDKTKSILFSTKNKKKDIGTLEILEIKYGNNNIKQYLKVIYLGCEIDENLSGEAMAFKVVNKINGRLRFLYRKKKIFIAVSGKALMQCYNSTTFRLCLFNRDLNRGCLVIMFSLRFSGSKFLIILRRQMHVRRIFLAQVFAGFAVF